MHCLGPPTRDPPVLTPTLVLSLRVPLCDRRKDQWLDCRSTATSASSSPARLVTLVRSRTAPYLRSSCSDEGLHQHQLRSLSRSWRSHPWSSGAQRQHCPQATVLFFWTANLYPPPPPPRVSLKRLLRWNYAELSLQQPCKNFVEFRWRNLRQSPIYRSPVESGRESGRV